MLESSWISFGIRYIVILCFYGSFSNKYLILDNLANRITILYVTKLKVKVLKHKTFIPKNKMKKKILYIEVINFFNQLPITDKDNPQLSINRR